MDIVAKPCYTLPLIGAVKYVALYTNSTLLAQCNVTREGKSLGEFELVRSKTIGQIIVKFKDKLRQEFEVIDNIEKCRWTCEFAKSHAWISFSPVPMTIRSEKLFGEFSTGGLILLDHKCIGRIGETSTHLFGRRFIKMEVKDEAYINLLMSISLVKVLQHKVYRLQDSGD